MSAFIRALVILCFAVDVFSEESSDPLHVNAPALILIGTDSAGLTAVNLAAGLGHTCALRSDNSVVCWGYNDEGQLGIGSTANVGDRPNQMGINLTPVNLGTGYTIVALIAGWDSVCSGRSEGMVCWGANSEGQLGIGSIESIGDGPNEMGDALVPVNLGNESSVVGAAAGQAHVCALRGDGNVVCWGRNDYGQLGKGDTFNVGVSSDQMGTALVPVDFGSGPPVMMLALGMSHTCALRSDLAVLCWGANTDGQLGIGSTDNVGDGPNEMGNALTPVDLVGGGGQSYATALTAGESHTCALLVGGTIVCWGGNADGQLGIGSMESIGDGPNEMGDALTVVDLGTGQYAATVVAGARHTCALRNDGTVVCWGYNVEGQLGIGGTENVGDKPNQMGDALTPVDLGTGQLASAVVAGFRHTCALRRDGSVVCWGWNLFGQLGVGHTMSIGDGPNEMGNALVPVDLSNEVVVPGTTDGGGVQEGLYMPYSYFHVPAFANSSLCQLTNLTLMVWVCVDANFTDGRCPAPPDRACYIYNYRNSSFVYWGPDSYLRLSRLT